MSDYKIDPNTDLLDRSEFDELKEVFRSFIDLVEATKEWKEIQNATHTPADL